MITLAKILLIDDDIDQHNLIRVAIPTFTELDCASDILTALSLLHKNTYDLLIVDINLNEANGLNFIESLKAQSIATDAIKMILTASDQEKDEIASHKLEVDDFIHKPIKPLAFKALIERHLKKKVLSNVWIKGRLKIDVAQMLVDGKDEKGEYQKIIVTPKEFKILVKLIKNIGQVFSREQIFDGTWNEEDDSYLRAVDTHVSSLRKKLDPYGVKLTSVRSVGYKIELVN